VIALSEFRTKPGAVLCSLLKAAGWPHVETTNPVGSDNGIAVFSRTPLVRARKCPAPPENVVRWLDIDLPEHGFGFGVLHILCAVPKLKDGVPGEAKTRFWNAALQAAETRFTSRFCSLATSILAHRLDEAGKTFVCAEHFGKLSACGWTDVWRNHNNGTTKWTWYSKLKGGARGNGFPLDHCFATPSLLPRATSCRYSHSERDTGISDHSIAVVEVKNRHAKSLQMAGRR
jgi:exonuclease III